VYGASDGLLRAIPFDVETLSVAGTSVLLYEGLMFKASGATDFDLSEGGRLIYATGGRPNARLQRSVVWVDRNGREEPIEGITPRGYAYARLSPDGRRLVLEDRQTRTGLWIWDFASRTETRLAIGDGDFGYPAWSPDGSRIAYSETGSPDIRWKAANNSGAASVLFEGIGGEGRQQPEVYFFTPDGEHVVLRQQNILGRGDDVLMVPIGGGEPVVLLGESFIERNAELSPDGRWMAYNSDESGRHEIYVRPFPDVGSDQVQVSNSGGEKPRWSGDGRELFYLHQPADPTELMSVAVEPVAPGERFRFGERRALFDWPYFNGAQGRTYDVTPDGQRFIAVTGGTGTESRAEELQMTVVLNWFTELRERMGSN